MKSELIEKLRTGEHGMEEMMKSFYHYTDCQMVDTVTCLLKQEEVILCLANGENIKVRVEFEGYQYNLNEFTNLTANTDASLATLWQLLTGTGCFFTTCHNKVMLCTTKVEHEVLTA